MGHPVYQKHKHLPLSRPVGVPLSWWGWGRGGAWRCRRPGISGWAGRCAWEVPSTGGGGSDHRSPSSRLPLLSGGCPASGGLEWQKNHSWAYAVQHNNINDNDNDDDDDDDNDDDNDDVYDDDDDDDNDDDDNDNDNDDNDNDNDDNDNDNDNDDDDDNDNNDWW